MAETDGSKFEATRHTYSGIRTRIPLHSAHSPAQDDADANAEDDA